MCCRRDQDRAWEWCGDVNKKEKGWCWTSSQCFCRLGCPSSYKLLLVWSWFWSYVNLICINFVDLWADKDTEALTWEFWHFFLVARLEEKKTKKTKHMKSSTCNLLSIFFKCRMKQEGGMFLLLLFAFFYLSFLKLYVIVQVKFSWFIWIAGSLLWVSEIQWDHDLLAIKEAVCLVLVLLAQAVLIDCTGN